MTYEYTGATVKGHRITVNVRAHTNDFCKNSDDKAAARRLQEPWIFDS